MRCMPEPDDADPPLRLVPTPKPSALPRAQRSDPRLEPDLPAVLVAGCLPTRLPVRGHTQGESPTAETLNPQLSSTPLPR